MCISYTFCFIRQKKGHALQKSMTLFLIVENGYLTNMV